MAAIIVAEESYPAFADVNLWLHLHVYSLVGCISAINASAMKFTLCGACAIKMAAIIKIFAYFQQPLSKSGITNYISMDFDDKRQVIS